MYLENIYKHLYEFNILAVFAFIHLLILLYNLLHNSHNKELSPKKATIKAFLNPKKTILSLFLQVSLIIPAAEELIFRAPLIIFFNSLNDNYAIIGILFSSAVFGLSHYDSTFIPKKQNGEKAVKAKMISTTIFGIIFSSVAIYYQSVLIALIIHSSINFISFSLVFLSIHLGSKRIKRFDKETRKLIFEECSEDMSNLNAVLLRHEIKEIEPSMKNIESI